MSLEVIILAAGDGVRMQSSTPKSLHCVAGRPMVSHIIQAAHAVGAAKINIVTGAGYSDRMRDAVARDLAAFDGNGNGDDGNEIADKIKWVTQEKSLGTGHAVLQAMPNVSRAATVLILYGDTPLLGAETLTNLIGDGAANKLHLLTVELADPTGLGRIVRDAQGSVVKIVEEKDADGAQRSITECNTGCIAAPMTVTDAALAKLDNHNAQQEFYLTDIVGHAAAAGVDIVARRATGADEVMGVNNKVDLARAERIFQRRQARRLMEQGVCLHDPARFDLRGVCNFGRDCTVDVNVILEGRVRIGDGCVIGANTVIRNSEIGDGSMIESNCVIEDAVIGARCTIGPFARLRPQTEIADEARVGNFVEIKKSTVGRGAKINHLSYVGDSTVGSGANIGAGVITCNYDGAQKHRTVIGDDVFIGSNAALVAPLEIKSGATIAAGSTITDDVAADKLALGRARQTVVDGWTRPRKK